MKLYELLDVLGEYDRVKISDSEGKVIAEYDGKDSIPAILNGADVLRVLPFSDFKGPYVIIDTNFVNNMRAIDGLCQKMEEFKEEVATDEYRYSDELSVNSGLRNFLTDLISDCERIRNNLDAFCPWNDGLDMYK